MKHPKQLSNAEIASFCGQIAMLFQAGITPAESVSILLSDSQGTSAASLLKVIRQTCLRGEPFHKALAATGVFPEYVLHTIALGEESGRLDDCMMSLANYYEKEDNTAESIRNAVTYPFIMVAMMIAVIFVLVSKVMPIFNQVFIELGSEMSGFAASLLKLGNTLNRYSIALVVLLCLLMLLYFILAKTTPGKRLLRSFITHFPLTRDFYESVACERFASGMALAISSGMDTFNGLDMVSRLVGSKLMQVKIVTCKQQLRDGATFAEALIGAGIFNHLHSQMIQVGFKSGNVDTVLTKIAENYEKETDRKLRTMISVLEPTLVIVLSMIVGLILLSVILPLIGIMTSMG